MAKCMNCGFDRNRTGAKFCSNCGARLTFLAPGDVLQGRYEIIDVLGKGGMGAICLAEDRQALGSKCVIKEMIDYFNPADPNEVRKAQQRFEDEARTLAQLNHPSIPDVRQFFSEAGRNYLVMEFVEGENLEERIAREGKPLPQEEAIQCAIQVCRVLEYLGAQQPPLVHHDIKPANIVVNKGANAISLVDFGTAKTRFVQMGGQLGQGRSSVYGTVGYAPPEQYGDKPQTEPRSDVYALGATLYYLLTNDDPSDHPFHFPELSMLPAAIRKVLEGSLNPDVHQRPTATQMRQELKDTGIKTSPFHFRSGATAHNVAELVELCDRHWEDANFHFYRGDFENWLRNSLHRGDLEGKAATIRQSYSDQDEGLEALLHRLDPSLPVPVLQVDPPTLDFKRMQEGEVKQDRLSITNVAPRGYLGGKISVDPPAPWLSVPDRFQGNQVTLDVEVNAAEQPEGTRLTTKLGLETEYEPPVEVPVRARVAFGWRRFVFDVLGATSVSTAIWFTMTHLIRQALIQGFSEGFDLLLAEYASVGAVVLALIIGFRRGVSRDFSRLGFLIGAAVGFLAVGYASLGMAMEFLLLSKAGGEQLALISLVTLGAFVGLVSGSSPGTAARPPTGPGRCSAHRAVRLWNLRRRLDG